MNFIEQAQTEHAPIDLPRDRAQMLAYGFAFALRPHAPAPGVALDWGCDLAQIVTYSTAYQARLHIRAFAQEKCAGAAFVAEQACLKAFLTALRSD